MHGVGAMIQDLIWAPKAGSKVGVAESMALGAMLDVESVMTGLDQFPLLVKVACNLSYTAR